MRRPARNLLALSFLVCASSVQGQTTAFPSSDTAATLLLRISWVDSEGPHQTSGTGITVDAEGLVMTAKHLLPLEKNQTNVQVLAFASPSAPQPTYRLSCSPVAEVDLAFCKPTGPQKQYPFPATVGFYSVSESQSVWIRGYPKGGAIEGSPGRIRAVESPLAKTSAILRVGYSGGPVYFQGRVVGIVHDGEPVADVKSDPYVMGLGRFTLLKDAENHIPENILAGMRRAQDVAIKGMVAWELDDGGVSFQFPPDKPYSPKPPPPYLVGKRPETTTIAYSIDETQDDHKITPSRRKYSTGKINASPGYKIISYELDKLSSNYLSDEKFALSKDGKAIEFSYVLTSGPDTDRYRGWLRARLLVKEQKLERK